MIKIGELLIKVLSFSSGFLILSPRVPTPQGIEGAMKCDVSKRWCTLHWCASGGWFITHENWTSCVRVETPDFNYGKSKQKYMGMYHYYNATRVYSQASYITDRPLTALGGKTFHKYSINEAFQSGGVTQPSNHLVCHGVKFPFVISRSFCTVIYNHQRPD